MSLSQFDFENLPHLREALAEFAEREHSGEPNYPLGCCLLFEARSGLSDALIDYLRSRVGRLDELTGDHCVVFVPGSLDSPSEEIDRIVLATVRHLELSFDALPCAVFFLPSREHSTRVVLRLTKYIPPGVGGYGDEEVDVGLHAIAEATRRAARQPSAARLSALRRELEEAHKRNFRDSSQDSESVGVWTGTLSASASVVGALAAVASLI